MPKRTPQTPNPGAGRPSKLTAKLTKELCDLLEIGNYFEPACRSVGINPDTAYNWLTKARTDHPEGVYAEFSEAILRACAKAETNALLMLSTAAAGDTSNGVRADPRAALELLRRRWPERWGDTQKVTINAVAMEEVVEAVLAKVELALKSSITDPTLRKAAIAAVYSALAAEEGTGATATASA